MQIRVGFDVVHLRSLNERAKRRPARSAAIRASEQVILPTECNGADRAAVRIARLGRPVKKMIGGIEGWKDEGLALAQQ